MTGPKQATRRIREIREAHRPPPLKAPAGAFPLIRESVALWRESFPGCELTWASEPGHGEIGEKWPEGVCPNLPPKPPERRRGRG